MEFPSLTPESVAKQIYHHQQHRACSMPGSPSSPQGGSGHCSHTGLTHLLKVWQCALWYHFLIRATPHPSSGYRGAATLNGSRGPLTPPLWPTQHPHLLHPPSGGLEMGEKHEMSSCRTLQGERGSPGNTEDELVSWGGVLQTLQTRCRARRGAARLRIRLWHRSERQDPGGMGSWRSSLAMQAVPSRSEGRASRKWPQLRRQVRVGWMLHLLFSLLCSEWLPWRPPGEDVIDRRWEEPGSPGDFTVQSLMLPPKSYETDGGTRYFQDAKVLEL